MPYESVIAPCTLQSYLQTQYHVYAEPPFTLEVGKVSAALHAAHRRQKTTTSAYLTASNPFSEALNPSDNKIRQHSLAQTLTQRSLVFLPGLGRHPDNPGFGEESFLVFGLTLVAAKVLGERFDQNAIIWSDADAVPQLILLR